ncbi:MAG: hypothetical protein ABL934_09680 [Lysobacteraceae bacterium]
MLTEETLSRLEAAALKQSGLEFGTTIALMPGELTELVRVYRQNIAREAAAHE